MEKENRGKSPQVRRSLMASCFHLGTSVEEKESVLNELINLLLKKRVLRATGELCYGRERALDYLLEVMPLLEKNEIQLIISDGDAFYERFCFTPSKNTNSLYSKFKRMGISLQGRYNNIAVPELFKRYSAEMWMSPYELSESGVINSFLEEIEEPSTVDLAMDFDGSEVKRFKARFSAPFFNFNTGLSRDDFYKNYIYFW